MDYVSMAVFGSIPNLVLRPNLIRSVYVPAHREQCLEVTVVDHNNRHESRLFNVANNVFAGQGRGLPAREP